MQKDGRSNEQFSLAKEQKIVFPMAPHKCTSQLVVLLVKFSVLLVKFGVLLVKFGVLLVKFSLPLVKFGVLLVKSSCSLFESKVVSYITKEFFH